MKNSSEDVGNPKQIILNNIKNEVISQIHIIETKQSTKSLSYLSKGAFFSAFGSVITDVSENEILSKALFSALLIFGTSSLALILPSFKYEIPKYISESKKNKMLYDEWYTLTEYEKGLIIRISNKINVNEYDILELFILSDYNQNLLLDLYNNNKNYNEELSKYKDFDYISEVLIRKKK